MERAIDSTPVSGKFALDAVAGAAHTGALGVAALNHKSGDNPVEDGAVIEALLHQGDKVLDGIGGDLRIKLRLKGADSGLESHNGMVHKNSPF